MPRGLFERLKTGWSVALQKALTAEGAVLVVALGVGAFLRVWEINQLGLNSDEAVYAGQAAAIAGDAELEPFFSAFRAHPAPVPDDCSRSASTSATSTSGDACSRP